MHRHKSAGVEAHGSNSISPEQRRTVRATSIVTKVSLNSPTESAASTEDCIAGNLLETFSLAKNTSYIERGVSFSANDLNSLRLSAEKDTEDLPTDLGSGTTIDFDDVLARDKFDAELPSKEGALKKEKKRKSNTKYITQFFWTNNYYLIYSKHKNEKSWLKDDLNVIDLRTISKVFLVRRNRKLGQHFVLESDQFGEMLMLKARSNKEANLWVEVLNKRLNFFTMHPTPDTELSSSDQEESEELSEYDILLDDFVSIQTPLDHEFYYEPEISKLLVRSREYIETSQKCNASSKPFMRLLCCDVLRTSGRIDHILSHPENRVYKFSKKYSLSSTGLETSIDAVDLEGDTFFDSVSQEGTIPSYSASTDQVDKVLPFIYAVHIQIPGPPFYSVVSYFAPEKPGCLFSNGNLDPKQQLYNTFFLGDSSESNSLRDERFKLIPRIVDGPFVVKAATPSKPALLGKKLTQRYFTPPTSEKLKYLELCIDVGSSIVAWKVTKLSVGYAKFLTVDLFMLIEGRAKEELPEEVIGAVRIRHLDLSVAKTI